MASRNNCAIKFAYDHSRRVCSSEVLATFPFGEFISIRRKEETRRSSEHVSKNRGELLSQSFVRSVSIRFTHFRNILFASNLRIRIEISILVDFFVGEHPRDIPDRSSLNCKNSRNGSNEINPIPSRCARGIEDPFELSPTRQVHQDWECGQLDLHDSWNSPRDI